MPILKPGAAELHGLDVTKFKFSSELPEGGHQGISILKHARDDFGRASLMNFGDLAVMAGADLAVTRGIPKFHLDGLSNIIQNWPQARGSEAIMVAVRSGGKQIIAALKDWNIDLGAMTSVPIVGWIAGLLEGLWNGIVGFDSLIKAIVPDKVAQAVVYGKSKDESRASSMLNLIGHDDWTSIFSPSDYNPPGFGTKKIAWGGNEPQGRQIYASVGAQEFAADGGHGVVPGLPLLDLDWYQYANGKPPSETQGAASVYPSALQLGGLMWQMVMKPSVQMFSIDSEAIVQRWENWYQALARFARDSLVESSRDAAAYAVSWQGRFTKYNASTVPLKYRHVSTDRPFGFGLDGLVKYIITDEWRPRLHPALSTILCAYVHPNAPAMGHAASLRHAPLREHHLAMRKLLLTHPARHDVELDLIPDHAYRNEMAIAQTKGAADFVAAGWTLEGAPGILPDPVPLPPDGGPALPTDDEGGGILGPVLVVGGLAGAGWLGRKLLRGRRGMLRR